MIKKLHSFYQTSIGKTAVAFIDQGILSAANFLFGILVIKFSTKEEYGLYVLAYSFIMLGVGFQNALINTQATVLAPQKNETEEKQNFLFSLYIGQYRYWLGLAVIICSISLIAKHYQLVNTQHFSLVIATTTATLFYFLREYNRTISFIELKSHNVLWQDVFFLTAWFGSFIVLKQIFAQVSIFLLAIYSIGLASLLVSSVMTMIYKKLIIWNNHTQREYLKECWQNGKWSLLGVIITWIEAQSYIYLLTMVGGVENTASANAARQFFMPVMLLSVSYGRIFRPKWATERSLGNHQVIINSAKKAVTVLIGVILFYALVISFAANTIIPIIYSDEYKDSIPYILIWAVYFCLNIAVTNSSAILQVYEKFKTITLVSAITAIITVTSTLILVKYIGGIGSIVAMCIGQLLLLLLFHVRLQKDVIK